MCYDDVDFASEMSGEVASDPGRVCVVPSPESRAKISLPADCGRHPRSLFCLHVLSRESSFVSCLRLVLGFLIGEVALYSKARGKASLDFVSDTIRVYSVDSVTRTVPKSMWWTCKRPSTCSPVSAVEFRAARANRRSLCRLASQSLPRQATNHILGGTLVPEKKSTGPSCRRRNFVSNSANTPVPVPDCGDHHDRG